MSRADSFAVNDKAVQDFVLDGEISQAEVTAGAAQGRKWFSLRRLRLGFALSLTDNGYIALPVWLGGFILQWGTTPVLTGDTDNAIPLPLAFPNAGLVAQVTPLNSDSSLYKDNTGQVKSITKTTLTIRCNVISGNMTSSPYMWLALGC